MRQYDDYRISGLDYLESVPSEWNVKKAKYFINEINERSELGSEKLLSVSEYYGVLPKGELIEEDELLTHAETLEGYKKCKKGDIVMNIMLAWKKSLGISNFDGIVSPAYAVFRLTDEQNPKYYHYLFRTDILAGKFKRHSTGIIDSRLRLYPDIFMSLKFPVPPLDVQNVIVQFLDNNLVQIDSLIDKRKKMIELLHEERTAVINQVVTKGINPKIKMKNSGIEWIGEIPVNWKTMRIKYVTNGKLEYGANESAEFEDINSPRYIRITDFGVDGKLKIDTFRSLPFGIAKEFLLKEGDILFARSGATVGKTFQFKGYKGLACFAGYLIKASPDNKKIISDFLYNFTKSSVYESWKNSIFIQSTIQNIGADKYSMLKIPLPEITEQQQIVKHIESETSKIDRTLSQFEQEIALLQEYKTALISEAVTGKIDVREEVQYA